MPVAGPSSETNSGSRAVDLAAASGDPLGELGGLHVLDDEDVGARIALLLESRTSRSITPALRAHALDGRDLAVDREDRLDLQRRAEERLRGADPATPA